MPINARLARLADNPFARLAELLAPIEPRANEPPILMSVGEPQHETPPLAAHRIAGHAHLWNRYPPMQEMPEYRAACAGRLARGRGSANPGRRYIRLALVHDDATVAAGLERLARVLQ